MVLHQAGTHANFDEDTVRLAPMRVRRPKPTIVDLKVQNPHMLGKPIFADPTGRRKQRAVSIWLCALLVGFALFLAVPPIMDAPWWKPEVNADPHYPQQLVDSGMVNNLPVIGPEQGVIHRVVRVHRAGGQTLLTDPFSPPERPRVFRSVDYIEAEQIGNRQYVMERYGIPPDRRLMLTFDDGPDPQATPELLNLLSRERVPATFFAIGENVVFNPAITQRVVREGHLLANHSATHDSFQGSDVLNRRELISTGRIFHSVAGYDSPVFRIPRSDPEQNVKALLQSQQTGHIHVNMNMDTLDWNYPAGATIPTPQLDGRGYVVLLHDGGGDRMNTVAMVERFIRDAKAQGYTFSTVAPLLPPEGKPDTQVSPTMADRLTHDVWYLFTALPLQALQVLSTVTLWSFGIITGVILLAAWRGFFARVRREWGVEYKRPTSKVSVIVPCYNEGSTDPVEGDTRTPLERSVLMMTVESLLASTYLDNIEILLVDDGSKDDTWRLMRELKLIYPQLRLFTKVNGGKSTALNLGVKMAKYDLVVTLDGDTMFEPETIEWLVHRYETQPSTRPIGAVAGLVKVGNRRTGVRPWTKMQSSEYVAGTVVREAECALGSGSILPGACTLYLKRAIIEAGGFKDDTKAEDAEMTLAIQKLPARYRVLQEIRAVAWTEAPMKLGELWKQRQRWTYGNLQAFRKHWDMIGRKRYGTLGLFTLPYAIFSIVVPMLFNPLVILFAALTLYYGNYEAVARYMLVIAIIQFLLAGSGVLMMRESWWHLVCALVYELYYKPLWAALLVHSLLTIITGGEVGWNKLKRHGNVAPGLNTSPGVAAIPA